jgi:ubiquitin carboxyl-terminal hydrolase L5
MSYRRLDLLNAALSLQNAVDKRKRLKARTPQSKKTKLKGGKSTADSAYHFVAFVPVGRKVWQLDGLRAAPQYIGNESFRTSV